jgi:MbtH protein
MNDMLVVLNDEEQYSIWSADRPIPAGWRPEGFAGTRAACLAHIDAAWTDMRPRSVREAMSTRSQE